MIKEYKQMVVLCMSLPYLQFHFPARLANRDLCLYLIDYELRAGRAKCQIQSNFSLLK